MSRLASFPAILILLAYPVPSIANPIGIDFNTLTDSEFISTQYSGVTFSNAIALTAGISLDEFEFPPESGSTVASDYGAPMQINFAQSVNDVGGYFTYAEPLTLDAYSARNVLLGSVSSPFSNNEALSGVAGSSPNEFLNLPFNNISYVTFAGDPFGGSFTLDDLTYTPGSSGPSPVPEPGTLSLILLGGIGAILAQRGASPYARKPYSGSR